MCVTETEKPHGKSSTEQSPPKPDHRREMEIEKKLTKHKSTRKTVAFNLSFFSFHSSLFSPIHYYDVPIKRVGFFFGVIVRSLNNNNWKNIYIFTNNEKYSTWFSHVSLQWVAHFCGGGDAGDDGCCLPFTGNGLGSDTKSMALLNATRIYRWILVHKVPLLLKNNTTTRYSVKEKKQVEMKEPWNVSTSSWLLLSHCRRHRRRLSYRLLDADVVVTNLQLSLCGSNDRNTYAAPHTK